MIWPFRKRKPTASYSTGVGGVLSAAHRDQITGQLHGHDWEITAWFPFNGQISAEAHQHTLKSVLERLDHTVLPDEIAWGEKLAEYVCRAVNSEHSWYDGSTGNCFAVDVSRPGVRIHARYER